MKDQLNQLAQEIHQNAVDKGFHELDHTRSIVDNYAVWTANIHGETSELWEAARNGILGNHCDKKAKMIAAGIEPLTNEEEELADIIIRAFDTAGARGIDIGKAILAKHAFNKTRPHKHGGKLA